MKTGNTQRGLPMAMLPMQDTSVQTVLNSADNFIKSSQYQDPFKLSSTPYASLPNSGNPYTCLIVMSHHFLEYSLHQSITCSSSTSSLKTHKTHCQLGHSSLLHLEKLCPGNSNISILECESYHFAKHQHVSSSPRFSSLECLGSLCCIIKVRF